MARTTGDWKPDVLGRSYYAETIPLPDDDEGEVVATLVRRRGRSRSTKAVLHVHGFADYFFQTSQADYWLSRGYDFYAVDLRKYGRSLRPHQTPNFVTDLTHYYEDLDALLVEAHAAGVERFCDERDRLVGELDDPRDRLGAAIEAGLPTGPDDALMSLLYEFDVLAGNS